MKWERTFELSAPPERVWKAFMDDEEEVRVFRRDDAYLSRGGISVDITAEEVGVALAWTETEGDHRWDMSVTFTETDTGTSVTIVRSGFGDDDGWLRSATSRWLGWQWVMADLEIYYRTGRMPGRFYSTPFVALGIDGVEDGGGVRALNVIDGSPAAEAGMRSGDILISLGGAPVYGLTELWTIPRLVRGETELAFVRGAEIHEQRCVLAAG